MAVIIEMRDDIARPLAAEITFLADLRRTTKLKRPNPWIVVGNQIANVLAVRLNQEFPVPVSLLLKTANGFR